MSFDPVPWLSNCHVQTIGGFLLRESASLSKACAYVPKNPANAMTRILSSVAAAAAKTVEQQQEDAFWDQRERIETPDGDWFHADTKFVKDNKNAPTVILLHGLESNSDSPAVKDMARAFHNNNMHCTCLNFRGCSGTPNDTIGGYHLGFTDDLKFYLDLIRQRNSSINAGGNQVSQPIYLSGFSLGANAVLKCLGELGQDAVEQYDIAGAAVLCAPLDQAKNTKTFSQPGINREIYNKNLLQSMKKRVDDQLERFCNGDKNTDRFDYYRAMAAETVSEFDDAYIAPVYGFKDCHDYYQQTSSIFYLDDIAVPTLILNAKDDPFFDPTVWPTEKSVEHGGRAPLKMVQTAYGGHLGYFFHQININSDDDPDDDDAPFWAAAELGRFVQHVQSHPMRSIMMSQLES